MTTPSSILNAAPVFFFFFFQMQGGIAVDYLLQFSFCVITVIVVLLHAVMCEIL